MATYGATGAAISSDRVLPGLVAEKEGCIVRSICDPVEVVGIARTCVDIAGPPRPICCPLEATHREPAL